MRNTDGRNVCRVRARAYTPIDTPAVTHIKMLLQPAKAEFMDFVLFYGVPELCRALKKVHDLALYHSNIPITEREKSVLFDLKVLWESLEQMEREA